MTIKNSIFYINNNLILYDKNANYKYTYNYSINIINKIVDSYIEFNCHKLDILTSKNILDDINTIIEDRYKILDKLSVNKLISFSLLNCGDYFLDNELFKKLIIKNLS